MKNMGVNKLSTEGTLFLVEKFYLCDFEGVIFNKYENMIRDNLCPDQANLSIYLSLTIIKGINLVEFPPYWARETTFLTSCLFFDTTRLFFKGPSLKGKK